MDIIMKGLRLFFYMSIVICLFTLETNGQKAKPVHRIRGEVYFVQNGDTTKEMRPYDISLIDKDGIHPVFFIKTEHKYAFTIELNQELLEKYTHIQVRMNERTGGSSIDCISESHIPLRNNTNLKFYFDHCMSFIFRDTQKFFIYKPVLYIYPLQDTIVHIKHHYRGKHTFTYPLYEDGWTVLAKPNGDLMNLKDSTQHRYLFWEGISDMSKQELKNTEGFIIDSGDIVSFLEKTLSHIGLNPIESNDFITFWAPRMIMNKRCFIHFRINDNIRNTSFLEIEPKPESILRVFMEYTHQIPDWEIKEQSLPAFKRSGYSVIEWGGTELGSGVVH